MVASAGIRLSITDKDQVKADQADIQAGGVGMYGAIADAGDQSANQQIASAGRVSSAARSATAQAQASLKTLYANMEADAKTSADRANQAFKVAMAPSASGLGQSNGSARTSANAISQQMAQQEASARQLIAQLDPLGAAQEKYNKSLADFRQMAAYGVISAQQLAQAETLAKKSFDDATKGLGGLNEGAKLSTTQQAMLTSAVYRTFESFSSGLPVWRIAAQQGGEVAAAVGMGEGGAGGAMAALGAIFTPVTITIGAFVAMLAAGTAAAIMHSQSVRALTLATQGYGAAAGLSAEQAEAISQGAAKTGDVSIQQARSAAAAYLDTGRIGGAALGQLISLTQQYSELTGSKFKDAEAVMAQAFGGGAAGIAALNQKFDFLSAAQEEHVKLLIEEGHQTDALNLSMSLFADRVAGAANQTHGWTEIVHDLANAWDAVGSGIDRAFHGAADPEQRVKDQIASLQKQLERAQTGVPVMADDIGGSTDDGTRVAGINKQLAAANAKLAAIQAAPANAKANQQSLDDAAAVAGLNPQAQQIKDIQARITNAQSMLADSSGQRMAKEGTNSTALKQDIADGEREITELQKRSEHLDAHAASLARDTAALEANTRGTLAMVQAYLTDSASALKAEADRKAATDSIKKQGDLERAQADQLAAALADQELAGAKQVSTLKDQAAALADVISLSSASKLTSEQMAQLLEQETQTRPLQIAQMAAVKAGRQADAEAIQREIDLIDQLLPKYQQEQAVQQIMASTAANNNATDMLKLQLSLLGQTNDVRARALAQAQAEQELTAKNVSKTDPDYAPQYTALVKSKVDNATASTNLDAGTAYDSQTRALQNQIAVLELRQSIVGMSADDQQKMVDSLTEQENQWAKGNALSDTQRQNLLDMIAHQDDLTAAVKRMNDAWSEGVNFGDRLVDDLTQGKNIGKDLVEELLKLELTNPLENLLFNQNLPTGGNVLSAMTGGAGGASGGGLLSFLGGLFGGGQSSGITSAADIAKITGLTSSAPANLAGSTLPGLASLFGIPGFATGTDDAPPGWAWVGEDGPELKKLQGGDRIRSNTASMRMMGQQMAQQAQPAQVTLHVEASPYFDTRVEQVSSPIAVRSAKAAHDRAVSTAYSQAPGAVAQAQAQGTMG